MRIDTDNNVALRKESVDRNKRLGLLGWLRTLSLSARRAWIEIIAPGTSVFRGWVALRKESVDRNFHIGNAASTLPRSLSARRAWIEIQLQTNFSCPPIVALRKESVDRNNGRLRTVQHTQIVALRKESVDRNYWWVEGDRFFYYASLSARRAWIEIQ